MKATSVFIPFVFNLMCLHAQISEVEEEYALPVSLSESSGAIVLNGSLITHNDSGGQNKLYELDLETALVTRTITVSNATNIDWEDITQDENYIYVGDIGNNNGTRTDLKIYKINRTDILNNTNVSAEVINFSYANQTDFTSNPEDTEWDAEALISLNSTSLVLISKNWVNSVSSAYLISKTPGIYSLSPLVTSLNSGGLITGATYNTTTEKLYLVGYTSILQPFVWVCDSFTGSDIFSGNNTQTMLSSLALEQTEGITHVSKNQYLVTSESFSVNIGSVTVSDYAKLISFSTNDTTLSIFESKIGNNSIVLFPNPVNDVLNIKGDKIKSIEIFDTKLTKLITGYNSSMIMSNLKPGLYFVKIVFTNDNFMLEKVVKE